MEAKIGDIFVVRLKRKNAYFTAQIVGGSDKTGLVALVLDGFTKEPPSLNEAARLRPFYFDHHFWNRQEFYLGADEILRCEPVFIGNAAPVCELPQRVSLQDTEQICMQLAWNELPKDIRAKFKSARKQKLEIKQPQSREFYANLVRQNPFCYELRSEIWDENLKEFLEQTPMITELELKSAGKSLDISRTHLQELVLDASGTEEITLNDSLWRLVINGDIARLKSVRCPFDGELLSLQLNLKNDEFGVRGLEKLRSVRIFGARGICVDLARVAASFANLRELFINGQGGTLKNIDALAKFERLQDVWLSDIYGFESFPTRAQLPHIERLWLWSAPKTACEAAREQFKNIENFAIRQPRSKQWLAANLDNPLAIWDGREYVNAATSKKAMKAYSDAHKKLSALGEKLETAGQSAAGTNLASHETATDETRTKKSQSAQAAVQAGKFEAADASGTAARVQILKEFIAVFNAIDAKRGIDTIEREEIWGAFCKLCELAAMGAKDQEKIWEENAEF